MFLRVLQCVRFLCAGVAEEELRKDVPVGVYARDKETTALCCEHCDWLKPFEKFRLQFFYPGERGFKPHGWQ